MALTQGNPPGATTHWTVGAMAKPATNSVPSVQRIWRGHGLQPHRVRRFKLSAFFLTGGWAADRNAGAQRLERSRTCRIVLADTGCDSDAIRRQSEATGAVPDIPPKCNRRWKPCFSPVLSKGRNAIERIFGRLKDFRRLATRYDRWATQSRAAVCIAPTVGDGL